MLQRSSKPQAQARREENPPYLVDGIVMRFYLEKRDYGAYWYGHYTREDGRPQTRYFGKDDPRPKYPLYQAPPEPTGLVWLYGLAATKRREQS